MKSIKCVIVGDVIHIFSSMLFKLEILDIQEEGIFWCKLREWSSANNK